MYSEFNDTILNIYESWALSRSSHFGLITTNESDQSTYDAEYLFGLDLNGDSVQGRNIQLLDEFSFHTSTDHIIFSTDSSVSLLQDLNSGEILIASDGSITPQTLLKNSSGTSFLPSSSQTVIAAEATTNGNTQLLSWQDATEITRLVSEEVTTIVGRGRRRRAVTSTVTQEVTDTIDPGFYITTFDHNGLAISDAAKLGSSDQSTYDAEYLFGLDLNGDTVQGGIRSEFAIDFNFRGLLGYEDYFAKAASMWTDIIIGDLPDVGEIDDVLIDVEIFNEVSNVLGWAGPSSVRVMDNSTVGLTTTGVMGFNKYYISDMIENNSFVGVITHEIGHVLGFGTLWEDWNERDQYVDGPWNQYGGNLLTDGEFKYLGASAVDVYSRLTGKPETYVPLEDGASAPGAGSVGSHWSEEVFADELMTPIATGDLPISELTIAAISDLGYEVIKHHSASTSIDAAISSASDYLEKIESGELVFSNKPIVPHDYVWFDQVSDVSEVVELSYSMTDPVTGIANSMGEPADQVGVISDICTQLQEENLASSLTVFSSLGGSYQYESQHNDLASGAGLPLIGSNDSVSFDNHKPFIDDLLLPVTSIL